MLKAGDQLSRDQAPAIAGRAFTITAKFDTGAAKDGVIVAQGGNAIGYVLYLFAGKLHFLARNRGGVATVSTTSTVSGAHSAVARLDTQGGLTLALDGQASVSATLSGGVSAMPVDGLDVGEDTRGAVGPYPPPNTFRGSIESVVIEIDPRKQ